MGELLIKKAAKSKEQYSSQSKLYLEALKDDFPLEEFEAYVRKEIFIIGTSYITQFLEHKEKQKIKELSKKGFKSKPIPNHGPKYGV